MFGFTSKLRALTLAALFSLLLIGTNAMATFTPSTMDDIILPVNIASVATKVLTVGATIVVAVLGVWIAFKLINKGGKRLGRSV